MLRLLRQISFRQLRASWGRTSLVVGGIATGVALIVAINIINTSVVANFRSTIELIAGPAALEVTLGVGEVGFPEDTVDAVRSDPDVVAALPLVRGTISLADDSGETLQLFGADFTTEEELERYRIPLASDRRVVLRWMSDPRSILLTAAFASLRGIGIGEMIQLSTPNGVREFKVVGLLEPEGLARAFGGRLGVMDLPAAQMLLGKEGRIDQVDLILNPKADVAGVEQRIEAALPSTLSVARPAQRAAHYESIVGSFQAMVTGLSLLCLVAGIYIIYNTTSTGAVHRALVMAGLRVIGAEPPQLLRLLMLEALILGVVGTLIGIPGGVVLAYLLTGLVSDSMGVVFQLRFPVEALAIDLSEQVLIGVVGISAALFASFFPARRVTALDPLDVMRADLRSLAVRTPSGRLVAWWFALVLVSAVALLIEVQFKSIAWGNFGSTLWLASSIVIAIPLVSGSARILARLLARLFGAEGRLAAESLFRSPTRTGVTVAALALVLTVTVTVASLSLSHRNSVRSYFVGGFLASDLAVSAVATEGGWLETPVPGELADEISETPGVRHAESFRVLPGQMFRGERIAVAGGTDGFFQPERFPDQWFRAGDPDEATAAVRASEGAMISVSLADRFDLKVADSIELDTPTGPLALRIVGIAPDYISDRGSVILSRRLLVEHWRETMVNRIHVFLEESASLEEVRAQIATRFGSRYRLKVLSLQEGVAYLAEKIDRAYAFTFAIQLLIVVVTVAGIFDLLLAAIWERRRELALWRVIGADERVVRRSVIIESATIGGLGALLGVVVGLVTTWIWIGVNYRYLLGYYLQYHFALGATAWYITLVMVMTILAGYAAARHATRQQVLDGIQTE